jgi:hypothetical protein
MREGKSEQGNNGKGTFIIENTYKICTALDLKVCTKPCYDVCMRM